MFNFLKRKRKQPTNHDLCDLVSITIKNLYTDTRFWCRVAEAYDGVIVVDAISGKTTRLKRKALCKHAKTAKGFIKYLKSEFE